MHRLITTPTYIQNLLSQYAGIGYVFPISTLADFRSAAREAILKRDRIDSMSDESYASERQYESWAQDNQRRTLKKLKNINEIADHTKRFDAKAELFVEQSVGAAMGGYYDARNMIPIQEDVKSREACTKAAVALRPILESKGLTVTESEIQHSFRPDSRFRPEGSGVCTIHIGTLNSNPNDIPMVMTNYRPVTYTNFPF